MPYKVIKAGSKFAVHKLDADGKPTGKALGTHPDKAKADAQVRALMANEKPVKKELHHMGGAIPAGVIVSDFDDGELPTFTPHGNTDEDKTKDYYDNENEAVKFMTPSYGYGATTFTDLLAQRDALEMQSVIGGLTNDFGTLAYNISCNPDIEDKAAALTDLAKEFENLMSAYIQNEQSGETIVDELQGKELIAQIAGDNQPKKKEVTPQPDEEKVFIWKEGDTYHWLAAYSNNRLDDEQEIISSASHKEFDEALHKKEWPMPEVYLWHIPYPVGVTDYHAYDESAGFPIAAGHFYAGMEWAAEGILKEKWDGNSHGMPDNWVKYDPDNPKVIIRHRTKEITFLPLRAAANKLAFSIINKEHSMSDLEKGLPAHKRPEFVKAFGEERVKQMEAELAEKSKEADEAGIVKKEVEQPTGVTHAEIAEVLTQIKEMFGTVNTRIDSLEKSIVKEADQFDLMAILKSKSIIGKDAAKVDGRSILGKDMPIETEPQAVANAHPVGLINNLFAANANWADKGGRF